MCVHCLQTRFMDVITINRYYSWYYDPGHTDTIATRLATDLEDWFRTHGKPMMLTEYGAGTVAGLHRVSCFKFCLYMRTLAALDSVHLLTKLEARTTNET